METGYFVVSKEYCNTSLIIYELQTFKLQFQGSSTNFTPSSFHLLCDVKSVLGAPYVSLCTHIKKWLILKLLNPDIPSPEEVRGMLGN